jgi:hypothetical protein
MICANLIDRLYDPYRLLSEVHKHIKQGGFLIIMSPYTWLENFTSKANWVGGKITENGEKILTK